jgi:hypothetical protein
MEHAVKITVPSSNPNSKVRRCYYVDSAKLEKIRSSYLVGRGTRLDLVLKVRSVDENENLSSISVSQSYLVNQIKMSVEEID